jgi:hypothetical protein
MSALLPFGNNHAVRARAVSASDNGACVMRVRDFIHDDNKRFFVFFSRLV